MVKQCHKWRYRDAYQHHPDAERYINPKQSADLKAVDLGALDCHGRESEIFEDRNEANDHGHHSD